MAMSAYDEFLSAEDLRRERVAEDAARAAGRAERLLHRAEREIDALDPQPLRPEVYRSIRENLRPRSEEPSWQGAIRAADHAILESPDGFGALARMLMRLSDRLTRIESRLGLLDEEAGRGE